MFIYVRQPSIVVYSSACKYPSVTMLQERYCVVWYCKTLSYQSSISEAKEKTWRLKIQVVMLYWAYWLCVCQKAWVRFHPCWLIVYSEFKHLVHLLCLIVSHSEQCWKDWCELKHYFISLCLMIFCVIGNEQILIWFARDRILYAA